MTYGSRANAAAATATACGGQGCPSCVKTGLPVLLVRPGLADAAYANARRKYVEPLLKGVADQKLTASGYVMRTLRKGYLHAYYEHPHTPELKQQGGWQLFHVDEGGYLTPVALAAAGEDPKAFYCKRTEAYAIAMLFVIPDAANTQRVWVGFSDHPWSEPVRKRYAANESLRSKRMACIDAKAGRAERSLPMSVLNIEECVADYKPKLAQTHPEALRGNPFQGHQLTEEQPQPKDAKQEKKDQPHILDDEPPKKRREAALTGYVIQTFIYFGATAAAVGVITGSSATLLGLTATGWGLLLIALGVMVAFVVMIFKDKPPEKWAAKTLWGSASQKWGSIQRESVEANKVLLAMEADYSFGMSLLDNLASSSASSHMGFMSPIPMGAGMPTYTKEARLRIKLPEPLSKKLPWEMRIYAKGNRGESMIAGFRHYGNGEIAPLVSGQHGSQHGNHRKWEEDGYAEHVVSAKVDGFQYKDAYAKVTVFAPIASASGDEVVIVEEYLRD